MHIRELSPANYPFLITFLFVIFAQSVASDVFPARRDVPTEKQTFTTPGFVLRQHGWVRHLHPTFMQTKF